MKSRRYYLLALLSLVLALPGATADAQSSAAPVLAAESDCTRLGRDSAPPLPDSAENSKRLVDCGFKLSDQDDFTGSQQVFTRAVEMAKRRGDRASLASALYGYGGVLIAVGEGDRAEPLLVEN